MNKKNLPLIVGIAVPLLMIVFVAISIYLPVFLTKPQHDFIYATGDYYLSEYSYVVQSGKVTRIENSYPDDPFRSKAQEVKGEARLFYYDISEDKSTEVNLDQAREYNLDSNYQSPDGFEVVYGNSTRGVFPFFGGNYDYNTRYIRGNNYAKKLNLNLSSQDYYDNFSFLGWVK